MKVVFREEALADLDEIAQFIADHDAKAADRVVARIYRTIHRTIATLPLSGRLNTANGTREYAVPGLPYLVVYRPKLMSSPCFIPRAILRASGNRRRARIAHPAVAMP